MLIEMCCVISKIVFVTNIKRISYSRKGMVCCCNGIGNRAFYSRLAGIIWPGLDNRNLKLPA